MTGGTIEIYGSAGNEIGHTMRRGLIAIGTKVGDLVGFNMLAGSIGCRVVGVAGSDEKIRHIVTDLGYDAGFNYKTTDSYYAALKERCPNGIDVYFDNVGGPITDAVFPLLNQSAHVAICGQISQYNAVEVSQGPRLLWHLIDPGRGDE